MRHQILIALALLVMPTACATETKAPITPPSVMVNVDGTWRPVVGLQEIRHEKVFNLAPKWLIHHDVYVYEVDGTKTRYETYGKIAQVKDLRDYSVAHPVKSFLAKNGGALFSTAAWGANAVKGGK